MYTGPGPDLNRDEYAKKDSVRRSARASDSRRASHHAMSCYTILDMSAAFWFRCGHCVRDVTMESGTVIG